MKKKIAILGSTGSIGRSTLEVIKKDMKNFDVILLSANNKYKKLIEQAKEFKVKNISKFFLLFLTTSKVDFPIDPVDPSIAIFFFIME